MLALALLQNSVAEVREVFPSPDRSGRCFTLPALGRICTTGRHAVFSANFHNIR
jgi:hypothetical protein